MSAQQKNTAKLLSDVIGKPDGYSNMSKTTKTSFIRADQIVGAPFSVWRVKFGGNVLQCQEKLSHNIRPVCQRAGTKYRDLLLFRLSSYRSTRVDSREFQRKVKLLHSVQ